ncbi:MAG: right-handed parallel beta-helix repeat-containing protein, partial [Pseudomonadota bacterium]
EDVENGTQSYGPYYYDGTPPSASNLNPANGVTDAAVTSNLTLTLSDSNSGVNWGTFQIMLSGSKGYSKTYLYDSARVSKTGTPASYDVTVDPDTDFGDNEIITVTVNVSDTAGNAITPPTWSFTTVSGILYCDVPSVTYPTIQAGIDNCTTIVRVADGTYSENINFNNKLITVKSVNGAAVTKIQGSGANSPVVTFSSGETASAVLDGFTIDNQAAAGTASRGIYISASSAPTIKNCIVEGNAMSTGQNGAGVYINGGTATIQTSTIGGNAANKNSCASGCGLYATALSGPLSISNSTVSENNGTANGAGIYLTANGMQTTSVTSTTFTNNTAQNGGAIYNNGTVLSISASSSFTTNSASSSTGGGAIFSTGSGASTTIDGATFTGNTSTNLGGAIYITGSTAATPLSISNSTFTNNAATAYGGAIYLATVTNATTISLCTITGSSTTNNKGGGIYLSSSPITLTNTNITNSTSGLEGGGIYATGVTSAVNITGGSINGNTATVGGGIYLTTFATLTATGTTINSNRAISTYGGGIYNSSTVSLTKVVISGNRTNQRGGGIYAAGGPVTLTNCLVTGNTADGQGYSTGGGMHDAGGAVSIYNSTFAGNYATSSGGGFYATSTDDVVRNSIFWGNTAGSNAQINNGWPTTTYTDIQNGCASCADKTGNIDADPQFINLQIATSGNPTTAGNFHLCNGVGDPDAACTAASPCIDTASVTNAPADDIEGNTRPYDVSGKGDGVDDYDMGADEYMP